MLHFDSHDHPYPSKRSVVYAKNGMVCVGNPTAAMAGLQTLLKGGNAIDAALTVAAMQPVVEPTGNGIGSDCFAIVWYKNKLYGINGSGPAPQLASVAALKEKGFDKIPSHGVEPVNVPGAVGAWMALHDRFGSLELGDIMAPAISYAENGYPVSPTMSLLWQATEKLYRQYRERPEFQGWYDTFLPSGHSPRPGELFTCPDMARTLRLIAETHGEAFYRGELAEKIDAFMRKHKGFLRYDDLAAYKPEWTDPISTAYRGYDIWELPPNGHGITVLMALNILKGWQFSERDNIDTLHRQIEALKLSFVDTREYVAEPSYMKVSPEQLLSDRYAADRRALIGDQAIDPQIGDPSYSSTVYFTTADREGNMVSFIQSNFRGFGSGMVVPGTGIALNDRAENFSFDENHPNALAGGKRPYHTIIPAFITQNDQAVASFGIMGGFMQPQAHVQAVMNLLDFGLNPQQALDAPRWQWVGGRNIEVEQDMPNHLLRLLQRRGHNIIVQADPGLMGRGQIICCGDNGVYCGATEKRTDGQIACY